MNLAKPVPSPDLPRGMEDGSRDNDYILHIKGMSNFKGIDIPFQNKYIQLNTRSSSEKHRLN